MKGLHKNSNAWRQNMKPILKYQTHLKILSCPNTLVKELLKPVMEINSIGNEDIPFHILIAIPLLPFPCNWLDFCLIPLNEVWDK